MNYEKKYKEALEKARQFSEHPLQEDSSSIVEYIFPELKESEDERIRKELLEYANDRYAAVKNNATKPGANKIHIDWWGKAIAWLEKQDGKYSGGTSKEWTINDAATLKELIDFLENGTAKLQHDLTLYAKWLKIQFTPIEKKSEQKSTWSGEDDYNVQCLIAKTNCDIQKGNVGRNEELKIGSNLSDKE